MLRRCIGLFVALALVLSMAPAAFAKNNTPAKHKAFKLEAKFKDWDQAAWALKYIARMSAKGITKGYEDGSFKPNSSVSQVEAVVMVVRMKGTDAEQAAVAMAGQKLSIPGMSAYWWANGHVAYAQNQGWITPGDFHPAAAAKRSWVARLMVRALVSDWQAQVAAHANDVLPFTDAAQIRNEDRAYVAIAVSKKWMIGYPNGQFQPNKPVTRAELLALLDRGEATLPVNTNPYDLKGTVSAIDANARTMTVVAGGVPRSITISADALIFIEDTATPVALASVRVGDAVRVLLNGNNVAIFITVDDDPREVTGRISALNLVGSPRTITLVPTSTSTASTTYVLAADCEAYWSWTEVPLTNLVVGDVVKITSVRDTVRKIQVIQHQSGTPTGTQITGTIQSVSTSGTVTTLVVRDTNGINFTYPLAANAQLWYGGSAISVNQLLVGQTVQMTVLNSQITSLTITTQAPVGTTITGTLQSISIGTDTTTLVVRDANGQSHPYTLGANAALTWGASTITVSQLQAGQSVTVTVINSVITSLQVTAAAATEITGNIQVIETLNAVTTITVRDANGVDHRYPIAANATMTSGNVPITASQLTTGLRVRITVASGSITTLTVISQ